MTVLAWAAARDGVLGEAVRECLTAAIAAPSIHNTQPWRFRVRGETVDVFADCDRQLDIVDFRGRELLTSVGAAVLNLRVAVLVRGRPPVLLLYPDPNELDLIARIVPERLARVCETVPTLARAIPHCAPTAGRSRT